MWERRRGDWKKSAKREGIVREIKWSAKSERRSKRVKKNNKCDKKNLIKIRKESMNHVVSAIWVPSEKSLRNKK